MATSDILFLIIATATAASALGVVLARSVVRAAVWLLFTLIGVSLSFFLLGAEFLGAAQLIVYVGGTLVLVVFGVMLTSTGPFDQYRTTVAEWIIGGILALGIFAMLARVAGQFGATPEPTADALPGAPAVGLSFLGLADRDGGSAYLLPFEIVSVHLLVVLIGAAYLARAKRAPSPETPRRAS